MRRVRLTGSSTALSLAHAIRPYPRFTPHSTIEPLTPMIRLKTSYRASSLVRCWRRTYFGKFSIRTSTGSGLALKILSISGPTIRSWSVRRGFDSVLRVISDFAALAPALEARLLRRVGRMIAGRDLERPHQLVGAAFAGQLLEAPDRPLEVFGAEALGRDDLHDRRVIRRPRALVRSEQLFVQPLAWTKSRVDDLDVRTRTQPARANQSLGEADDLHRLAHVQHVDVARLGHGQGLDHERHRFADGHHVARHLGVGDGDRAAQLDLALERGHHAAAAADHVAKPHRPARHLAAPAQDHLLAQTLGASHHGVTRHGFVGRDEDEALHARRLRAAKRVVGAD